MSQIFEVQGSYQRAELADQVAERNNWQENKPRRIKSKKGWQFALLRLLNKRQLHERDAVIAGGKIASHND